MGDSTCLVNEDGDAEESPVCYRRMAHVKGFINTTTHWYDPLPETSFYVHKGLFNYRHLASSAIPFSLSLHQFENTTGCCSIRCRQACNNGLKSPYSAAAAYFSASAIIISHLKELGNQGRQRGRRRNRKNVIGFYRGIKIGKLDWEL